MTITDVRGESGQVDVSISPLDPPDQGLRLIVTPRTTGGSGRFSERVIVKTTSPRQPTIAIPVLASIEEGGARRSASAGGGSGGTR